MILHPYQSGFSKIEILLFLTLQPFVPPYRQAGLPIQLGRAY